MSEAAGVISSTAFYLLDYIRYFGSIRHRLHEKMRKLESAESLVAALVDIDDYLAFCDVLMSLKETQLALPGLVTISHSVCFFHHEIIVPNHSILVLKFRPSKVLE